MGKILTGSFHFRVTLDRSWIMDLLKLLMARLVGLV